MNKIEQQILEEYVKAYNVETILYEAMGKMLDEKYVENRLRMFNIKNMYIYGGTYLAVQLYRVGKKYSTIKGVVDRSGKIVLDDPILVLTLEEFRKQYNGETVIITPIQYYQKIKEDLELFVDRKNILDIGELLLGIA